MIRDEPKRHVITYALDMALLEEIRWSSYSTSRGDSESCRSEAALKSTPASRMPFV